MVHTGQPPEKPEAISMEEILNSIRQAMGETSLAQKNSPLEPSEPTSASSVPMTENRSSSGGSDILELTHPLGSISPSPLDLSPVEAIGENPLPPLSDAVSSDPQESEKKPDQGPLQEAQNLDISEDTFSSVASAFNLLSKAIEVKQEKEGQSGIAGQTVDNLMKDIMRPFIQDWLNQNLPVVVERLVAKEIERLIHLSFTVPK